MVASDQLQDNHAAVRAFPEGLSAKERQDAAEKGWTPLHAAALRGDADAVAALLSAGASVDAVSAPVVVQDSRVCVQAAIRRYGQQQWARLTEEWENVETARTAARDAHAATGERVSAAEAKLAAAQQTLRRAFAEEQAALEEAIKSSEAAVARAESAGGETEAQEQERDKDAAKLKYVASPHYQEAARAEEDLERVSKELLTALAGLSAGELREQLEQLRTVDPDGGVHRSEGIWSFQFHEKRSDLDTLTGQARILGVDEEDIKAVTRRHADNMQQHAPAIAQLICAKLANVDPAKPQQRADRLQELSELQKKQSKARRRAKWHREEAERAGRQFLKASAAYERARGMGEQQRQQVQLLKDELQRLHNVAESLELIHDEVEKKALAEVPPGSLTISGPPSSKTINDAEYRRKVKCLHEMMGKFTHSERETRSSLAAAGGDLQKAAQSWLATTPDIACSFSERQQRTRRAQTQSVLANAMHVESGPLQQERQETKRNGDELRAESDSYARKDLLHLIDISRSRGLYPPHSMNLGFPAAPTKPPGASSFPGWMNGPSAKQEFAKNRLWRQTWDKPVGVGTAPPEPRGVSAGLWSQDLPDDKRHDLVRNLLMGILQVRYGYEKVKPDVQCGDFLQRSVFVTRAEIINGMKSIDPKILSIENRDQRAKAIAEAEAQEHAEARTKFVSEVNNLFTGHNPDFSMEPHAIPLIPSFKRGVTVCQQLLGLVTFSDVSAKIEALSAAEKAASNESADNRTVPRISIEAKDTTNVALLTQFSEAELRHNLRESERQFNKAQQEQTTTPPDDGRSFFANYKIVAAREQVQRAAETVRRRQLEYSQAALELELAEHAQPAYNVGWDEAVLAAADDGNTSATKPPQWQVFADDESVLRRSLASKPGSGISNKHSVLLDIPAAASNASTVTSGSALTDQSRQRDSVALRNNLRQRINRLLSRADHTEYLTSTVVEEEELRQMTQNVANDSIDWSALNDASTLPTLLKYLVIPAALTSICKQLVHIAENGDALPEPAVWAQLLRASMQIDASRGCDAESMQVMAALCDWHQRFAPVGQTALHVAALQGHTVVCRLLLENGADPHIRDSTNGFTALEHAACAEADLSHRCAAATNSAKVSESACDDFSGSMSAEVDRVRGKHVFKLQRLRSGAAWLQTKKQDAAELTSLLRIEGVDSFTMNAPAAADGKPVAVKPRSDTILARHAALQAAAARGDCTHILNELCKIPEVLHRQDPLGFTLLHWASRNGTADVVALLIGRGASVNAKNNVGRTPLHCAKGEQVANLLLKAGADHTALDNKGLTPIQVLRGADNETTTRNVPSAARKDQKAVSADTNGASEEKEIAKVDEGENQAEEIVGGVGTAAKEGGVLQGTPAVGGDTRQAQRKRRIAERQRTLSMAKDAALQRRAKNAAELAVSTWPASAAGSNASTSTERLMTTRSSGRIQRARKMAANLAPTEQRHHYKGSQNDIAKAEGLFTRARAKLSAKEFDMAVKLLDEALRLHQGNNEIALLREKAAQEALGVKMEMLLQHLRFEEAAKAARVVLQRNPLSIEGKKWLQTAVQGLWASAREAGEKLDKQERLNASVSLKRQRQQKFDRCDPIGTVEEPHTHADGNYNAILECQAKESKHACEVLQRESNRAHILVRNAMAPFSTRSNSTHLELQRMKDDILVDMWTVLSNERSEAEQAVADAKIAIEHNDANEATISLRNALEGKRKARNALCNAAGQLPPPGSAHRKPQDYKHDVEAAYVHASKLVVNAQLAVEEQKELAKIDLHIARRRLARVEKLTAPFKHFQSTCDLTEDEIRRRWTGHADELVLTHFFKVQADAKSVVAVQELMRHYRQKWKGQDWRRKMYEAVASKYGTDPRVLWLEHEEAQKQSAVTAPRQGHAEGTLQGLEIPPSHLAHLMPDVPASLRQQQTHQATSHSQNLHRSLRDLNRQAAAAIDSFVAHQRQEAAARTAWMRSAQARMEVCTSDVKQAEERHTLAVQARTAAREASESDPPQISNAERHYLGDDVDSALETLKEARARAAVASQQFEMARAANESDTFDEGYERRPAQE